MINQKTTLAAVIGGILLFLFDGAFQAIPGIGVRSVERLQTNALTTADFDTKANRMSYLLTDNTVSFIATQSSDYYNMPRFFIIEFFTALAIAWLLALLFTRMKGFGLKDRLLFTVGFALIASFAIHLPYWNWWGFSSPYTLGVVLKTIVGWLLVAFIQNRFIFKTR